MTINNFTNRLASLLLVQKGIIPRDMLGLMRKGIERPFDEHSGTSFEAKERRLYAKNKK